GATAASMSTTYRVATVTPAAAPSPAAAKAQAAAPSLSPHPPILKGITTAVWTTISSATSSPRGAVQPATRAAMTNVAVCPATTSTEASVSCGHTPGASRPRRRSAATARATGARRARATGATERRRTPPGYARDPRQNVRQRGPNRRGQGQQHDGGHHGLDDLTAQPFPRHRAHPPRDVSSAPAVRDRLVRVAE